MHIAEVVTIAKSLPLLRLNTYKSLILSYSADYRRILGKNVERVIKKLALCIQHNTAQKASPPLFWIIDLVQDVIILSNKVTVALQPSTYILNGCCD